MLTYRSFVTALLALFATHCRFLPPQEHVTFPTQDGGSVYADLYGQSERGVVLAHNRQFNKESWTQQAHTLTDAGFRVLAFAGESRGPQGKSGGEIQDAVEYDVLTKSRSISSAFCASKRFASRSSPNRCERGETRLQHTLVKS